MAAFENECPDMCYAATICIQKKKICFYKDTVSHSSEEIAFFLLPVI